MTKEFYRDPYGFTASILRHPSGKSRLVIRFKNGSLYHMKTYSSYRGAKIALGKWTNGEMKLTGKEN